LNDYRVFIREYPAENGAQDAMTFLREYPLENVGLNGRLQSNNPQVAEILKRLAA
jgi:hypothetical protein